MSRDTAKLSGAVDPAYDRLNYWELIELALSYLPDDVKCKKIAWDSLDHLRERVGDRQSSAPESSLSMSGTLTPGYARPKRCSG